MTDSETTESHSLAWSLDRRSEGMGPEYARGYAAGTSAKEAE